MNNAKVSAISGIMFCASGIGVFNNLEIGVTIALTSLAIISLMTLEI